MLHKNLIKMKTLIYKLLIFETIFKQSFSSSTPNIKPDEITFEFTPILNGIGPTNTCSIVEIMGILHYNEIFLFCLEYEIPPNIEFFISRDDSKRFKFNLKSLFINRIVSRNIEQNKSTEFFDHEKAEGKGMDFDELNNCLGGDFHFSIRIMKEKIKKCNAEFLNLGNLIIVEETLDLDTDRILTDDEDIKSSTTYTLGKKIEIKTESKCQILLEIAVLSSYKSNLSKKYASGLSLNFIIAGKHFKNYLPNRIIFDEKLKEKFLEKSKMKSNEEGKELYFRFPEKNEKEKILKELEGLIDYSILSTSIKTDKTRENEVENEEDIVLIKGKNHSDKPKDENNRRKGKWQIYVIFLVIVSFVILIIGLILKYVIFGKNSAKL